jgi:hypothetical protein
MRQIISTAVAAFILTACAAPAAGPRIANNPCDDPAYRALKAQPVDSLSQREFQQMQQGDAACAQVAAVLAASANDAPRGPEPRIDTDAWTQAMANESGQEIHIRNTSNVPIIVTEVTLNSCINLADACGRHFPRVRINVGDVRRVLRVRYGTGTITSSFQYSYRVEPADPGRN